MKIGPACLAILSMLTAAARFAKPLQEASSREELVAHLGSTIGFASVEKREFTTGGTELIVFGYGPYSGRAACYVIAYYQSSARQKWLLFMDRLLEPATGVSAVIRADHS